MEPSELDGAVEVARAAAAGVGLRADQAIVVNNSDRIAVRLLPCDILARVGPAAHQAAFEFEVEVGRRLAAVGGPVAELAPRVDPGVHVVNGFVVSLWAYYDHEPSSGIEPGEYAEALARLHAAFRNVDLEAPHFTTRVADAASLVADPEQTPDLPDRDRALVASTLDRVSTAVGERASREQLLHGEPHPGNLLRTGGGPLFIDLETCCRGPVEFDIAHGLLPSDGRGMAAEEVLARYPGADHRLVIECQALMWAMITMWRWRRGDQFPNGLYWRTEGLNRLRAALDASGG